jgi:hypothetical protein
MIVFDALPVTVQRGELVPIAGLARIEVDAPTTWAAVEKLAAEGFFGADNWEYSSRRTVRNYDPPWAVIHAGDKWVALYYKQAGEEAK